MVSRPNATPDVSVRAPTRRRHEIDGIAGCRERLLQNHVRLRAPSDGLARSQDASEQDICAYRERVTR
jgi:hypothetical protein